MSNASTGPRSEQGKERSCLNALKHGLRSERPVLPGEDPQEWDAFQAEIVKDLDPGSTLERELAERVALQLWRLRRAARYEAQAEDESALLRVVRYEAHVSRQLNQALQLLRQFQAERRACEEAAPRETQAPLRETQAGRRTAPVAEAPPGTAPEAVTNSLFGSRDGEAAHDVPPGDGPSRPDGAPPAPAVGAEFVRRAQAVHRNGVAAGVSPPETS